MRSALKTFLKKMYWLINYLPFNNSFRTRKTTIINEGAILLNCKFISKNNNTIIFHSGGVIRNTVFHIFGSNNIIEIGENASINNGEFWIEDDHNNVIIGSNTHLCGKIHLACTEGKTIRIGNDCLLSSEIVFRTGDSHSIVDLNGHRINSADDIEIGNHVWIGHRALIQKGVNISNNTVIATGAIVTKSFEETNIILAGVPAKIVKHSIDWRTERL